MRYTARRVLQLLPILLTVTILTFSMLNLLSGDPTLFILPLDATQEQRDTVRKELNLDRPIPVRYVRWLGGALTGDLGKSYRTGQTVLGAVKERLPVTVELLVLSQLIALGVAIPLGVLTGWRAGRVGDRVTSGVMYGLLSMPNFMIAVILILVFAVRLRLLPATGYVRLTANPIENLRSVLLPALSLAFGTMAFYQRLLRSDMIATLQEDFVTMARAKGLPNWQILTRHALRPSSFSLLTVVGLQLGGLIGGAVIIENLFALPGMGRLLVEAIFARDYLMVQGIVTLIAVTYVLVNLAVDLFYGVLDPRIRRTAARV